MKQFIAYIGSLIIFGGGGLALTNYFVDPAHVFSTEYVDKIVEGIRKGYNVEGCSNLDERLYKLKLAECYYGKSFDFLALGSSRIMTVSQESLNGSTLLNLGVSGCKIEDMIALLQISEDNNILAKNVIISVDPTLFNECDQDTRWQSIDYYYNKFMEIKTNKWNGWYIIKNLFSPSYFQASIGALFSTKKELKYVNTYINDGFTNRTDGSIYYDKDFRDAPLQIVDERAVAKLHGSFKDFNNISQERVIVFKKLIMRLKTKGVKIYFLKCPYHPILYDKIINIGGVYEAIKYINLFSRENDIITIGSFNPVDIGFNRTHFYDGLHLKKESIDSLFQNSSIFD